MITDIIQTRQRKGNGSKDKYIFFLIPLSHKFDTSLWVMKAFFLQLQNLPWLVVGVQIVVVKPL